MVGSKDIDIMVSGGNISGLDFAKYLEKYLREVLKENPKNIGVIKANPEKSKYLETATVQIYGNSVDFTSPRKEVYDESSRIPTITPATPQEDAVRRDFSINSLFINLNTNEIEDFTGHGLEDLKNGILRAPQDSKKMFMDDPLRVLRSIRIGSKLGFKLDPELINAAKDPDVQDALKNKVSRERLEIEIRKILTGPDPVGGMKLIKELGLLSNIFKLPEKFKDIDMDQNSPHHDFTVWGHTLQVLDNIQKLIKNRDISESDKFVLNMAALSHDLGKLSESVIGTKEKDGKLINTYHGHEQESARAAEYMLRNLPGSRVEEIERIKKLIGASRRVNPNYAETSQEANLGRKMLINFVRELGDDWDYAIALAHADSAGHKINQFESHPNTYYETMRKQIKELDPIVVKNIKPLVSGSEIMQMFDKKGGPWISILNKRLLEWQFETPTATKEDAIKKLKELYIEMDLEKHASVGLSKRADEQFIKEDFPKTCATCGKTYTSLGEFMSLQFKKDFYNGDPAGDPGRQCMQDWGMAEGMDMIYRDCDCGSTLSVFVDCVHMNKKAKLSKRSTISYAWWLSPEGKLYNASDYGGHHAFLDRHPELLDHEKGLYGYDLALSQDWIRIAKFHTFIDFEVLVATDSTINRIQKILPDLPQMAKIRLSAKNKSITVSYSGFVAARDLRDLEKIEKNETIGSYRPDDEAYAIDEDACNWFEDETGKYSVKKLIDNSENLESISVSLSDLANNKNNEEGLRDLAELINTDQEEKQRTKQADLSYPILIKDDYTIIDGFHRVLKAILSKKDSILSKKINNDVLNKSVMEEDFAIDEPNKHEKEKISLKLSKRD